MLKKAHILWLDCQPKNSREDTNKADTKKYQVSMAGENEEDKKKEDNQEKVDMIFPGINFYF